MSLDKSETLRYLFGLQQAQIDSELASAHKNLRRLEHDFEAYLKLPHEQKTPDRAALSYHHQMLLGKALQEQPNIPEEMAFFFVANPAQVIADDVADEAWLQGRTAE